MQRPIFVTGASGFLGRKLVSRLEAEGVPCFALRSRKGPAGMKAGSLVRWVSGDLLDPSSYRTALAGCDTVLHLAAATGKAPPNEYYRVNAEGTRVFAGAAKAAGVRRFLHVSTIAVKFRDRSRYHYALSKAQAEDAVRSSGMRWTIVRPTILMGRDAPVLRSLARLASLPLTPMFGDGKARVQPVSADDVAAALAALACCDDWDGRTIEAGGPEVLTIEDLVARIRRAQGRAPGRAVHLPARPAARLLWWVEPLLRPLLPVTAGQLASFTNDGTADPSSAPPGWPGSKTPIDEMLEWMRNGYTTA